MNYWLMNVRDAAHITGLPVQPVTVAEIVKVYGITAGHLYVIAHRRKWRRIRYDGRVYYDRAEVDQVLGRG